MEKQKLGKNQAWLALGHTLRYFVKSSHPPEKKGDSWDFCEDICEKSAQAVEKKRRLLDERSACLEAQKRKPEERAPRRGWKRRFGRLSFASIAEKSPLSK